jgi:diaminopimelate epimerase
LQAALIQGGFFCLQLNPNQQMNFVKYHGTGNDFILIDDRQTESFPVDDQPFIEHLCQRRFGIGADGLILLRNTPGYDFKMIYFNADGREGSMCGNGGRCIVRFAHDLGLFATKTRFLAVDGIHEAKVKGEVISLKMSDVSDTVSTHNRDAVFMHTGSPHFVAFVDDVAGYDVLGKGRQVRHDERFGKQGTNVNFVEVLGDNSLFVRTFERGVEDETYSCGTGVTAAALAAYHRHGMAGPVAIKTPGGNLTVSFAATGSDSFNNIWLIGPAVRVFSGEIAMEP